MMATTNAAETREHVILVWNLNTYCFFDAMCFVGYQSCSATLGFGLENVRILFVFGLSSVVFKRVHFVCYKVMKRVCRSINTNKFVFLNNKHIIHNYTVNSLSFKQGSMLQAFFIRYIASYYMYIGSCLIVQRLCPSLCAMRSIVLTSAVCTKWNSISEF